MTESLLSTIKKVPRLNNTITKEKMTDRILFLRFDLKLRRSPPAIPQTKVTIQVTGENISRVYKMKLLTLTLSSVLGSVSDLASRLGKEAESQFLIGHPGQKFEFPVPLDSPLDCEKVQIFLKSTSRLEICVKRLVGFKNAGGVFNARLHSPLGQGVQL